MGAEKTLLVILFCLTIPIIYRVPKDFTRAYSSWVLEVFGTGARVFFGYALVISAPYMWLWFIRPEAAGKHGEVGIMMMCLLLSAWGLTSGYFWLRHYRHQ